MFQVATITRCVATGRRAHAFLLAIMLASLAGGIAPDGVDKTYRYKNGRIKLVETTRDAQIVKSVWYLPSGERFRTTVWDQGTGTGYYLDDDGKLLNEIPYVDGVGHGWGMQFSYDHDAIRVQFV